MTATVVLGLAWGDEGKGRVCDALASDVGYVSRYSGGNNAGYGRSRSGGSRCRAGSRWTGGPTS